MPLFKTDEEFLLQAYKKATESPDPSTQNGAVIPFYHLGFEDYVEACNTFPNGVSNKPERLERPLKYNFIEHAERNVLHEALRRGVRTTGMTMFVPWFACADCARAIIGAGITKVVGHKRMFDQTPDHWKESIAHAFVMFEEAGVETVLVSTVLNGPEIRFNGQLWKP
jgi:dCMP deaminase